MTIQTNSNVLVAIKAETTLGVACATVTGATQVRLIGSPGLAKKRANIKSAELRDDGNEAMGRLGATTIDGSFDSEVTAGGHTDVVLQGIMRSAWVTATSVAFVSMTTLALGTNTVTAAGGDFIGTQGIRVGDIFTITGTSVVADNSLRLPVLAIGTLTITTVPAAFTTMVASATGTLTILKKLKNAAGGTPTRQSFNVEQYDEDIDISELFLGCRIITVKISAKPGAVATISTSFLGMDRTILTTGTSPFFTSPSVTTGIALASDDAVITYNGAVVATFTGFDLTFTIAASGAAVLGSFISPDIFDNLLSVTGTITALRSDLSNPILYDAETEFGVSILLKELMAAPQNCLSVFLPRVKLAGVSAPVGGTTGPKIETLTLMVGPKVAVAGFDGTNATFCSSAP